jgi:hypothetical protein
MFENVEGSFDTERIMEIMEYNLVGYPNDEDVEEEDLDAIIYYGHFGFTNINNELRTGEMESRYTKVIINYIKRSRFLKDIILFRGISFRTNVNIGETIYDYAFMSKTSDYTVAESFASKCCVYIMHYPGLTKQININTRFGEAEYLSYPGEKFLVVGKAMYNERQWIYCIYTGNVYSDSLENFSIDPNINPYINNTKLVEASLTNDTIIIGYSKAKGGWIVSTTKDYHKFKYDVLLEENPTLYVFSFTDRKNFRYITTDNGWYLNSVVPFAILYVEKKVHDCNTGHVEILRMPSVNSSEFSISREYQHFGHTELSFTKEEAEAHNKEYNITKPNLAWL